MYNIILIDVTACMIIYHEKGHKAFKLITGFILLKAVKDHLLTVHYLCHGIVIVKIAYMQMTNYKKIPE